MYHLLRNPPESTLHLRRAPPEPTKHSKKKQKPSTSKGKKKKQQPGEEEEIEQPPPTIIFCAKPRTAAYLTNLLKTLHIRTTALHSRLTQRERLSSLGLFRSSVVPVLVSTDVGARGLDIEDVALVINWDLPSEPEEYTHRVGRTARKGKGGVAVSFVTERDEDKVLKIEGRISKFDFRISSPLPLKRRLSCRGIGTYKHCVVPGLYRCSNLFVFKTDTKLTEMSLPEAKVLENLNAVSTAKRLANMVSGVSRHMWCPTGNGRFTDHGIARVRSSFRNYTTQISESGRRSTESRVPNADETCRRARFLNPCCSILSEL